MCVQPEEEKISEKLPYIFSTSECDKTSRNSYHSSYFYYHMCILIYTHHLFLSLLSLSGTQIDRVYMYVQ